MVGSAILSLSDRVFYALFVSVYGSPFVCGLVVSFYFFRPAARWRAVFFFFAASCNRFT